MWIFFKKIFIVLMVWLAFNSGGNYKTEAETITGMDESQTPVQYTSRIFLVTGIGDAMYFPTDGIAFRCVEIHGRYLDNGKYDIFYSKELKYSRMPKAKYYIFEYTNDKFYDGKIEDYRHLSNVKVIKDVKAFDDDDLLHNTKDIPYTSPLLHIREINENAILIPKDDVVLVFIGIKVDYNLDYGETFYSEEIKYKYLRISSYDDAYMFDYIYDTIGDGLLKDENLSNVKVIKNIHGGKSWPPFMH
jgi:hypothetical protein